MHLATKQIKKLLKDEQIIGMEKYLGNLSATEDTNYVCGRRLID